MRPVLQVGEVSVGGGQGRGEVGGLTAGFAANGAGMSSRVDPLHVLVPPVFRQRSASPKSSATCIRRPVESVTNAWVTPGSSGRVVGRYVADQGLPRRHE